MKDMIVDYANYLGIITGKRNKCFLIKNFPFRAVAIGRREGLSKTSQFNISTVIRVQKVLKHTNNTFIESVYLKFRFKNDKNFQIFM